MMFQNFIIRFTSGASRKNLQGKHSLKKKTLFYWRILLTTFFVMTVLVLGASFFVIQDISRGGFSPVAKVVVQGSDQVTLGRLEKLVSHFETKRVTFEQVRKTRTVLVDPSR